MSIMTIKDVNKTKFYQIPKAFFHNNIYKNMKSDSKLAYAMLRDLVDLSIKNNWVNDKNEIYVKLSRKKLMHRLNIKGTQKFAQVMDELEQYGLIVYKKVGFKECNEIYICNPKELECVTYNDEDVLEKERFENQTSSGLKIKPTEVRKSNLQRFENQTHNNTNTIDTKTIDTNNNLKAVEKIENKHKQVKIDEKEINLVNTIIEKNLNIVLPNKDLKLLSYASKDLYGVVTEESIINACNIVKASPNKIKNLGKYLYKAIREEMKVTEYKSNKELKFNNFDQRNCNYEELEDKLLESSRNSNFKCITTNTEVESIEDSLEANNEEDIKEYELELTENSIKWKFTDCGYIYKFNREDVIIIAKALKNKFNSCHVGFLKQVKEVLKNKNDGNLAYGIVTCINNYKK